MIELRHLKKTYENAEPPKDVSVTINDGDVIRFFRKTPQT